MQPLRGGMQRGWSCYLTRCSTQTSAKEKAAPRHMAHAGQRGVRESQMSTSRTQFRLFACVSIVIFVLAACLPVTTRTISLGSGYSLSEMDRAESIIESLGFSRAMFEPSDGKRVPRMKYDDEWIAVFQTTNPPAFGASVFWSVKNGELRVGFSEHNTKLSPEGETLLQSLLEKLRGTYGEQLFIESGR